jgi:uncharacterized protein
MALIKRKIESIIWGHISKKEITLIVGPRQAGKTTLMQLIQKRLQQQNIPTLFLNLDIERHNEYFSSQDTFLQKLALELPSRDSVVVTDEIQRKENAGLFLKGLYDQDTGYKFIISGSGSLELKETIHESLAGRKRIFPLFPLSFEEIVQYKTGYRYEDKLGEYYSIEKTGVRHILDEYLQYGGYPRVVLEKTEEEKRQVMDEIYRSYIDKDIVTLLGINRPDAFSRLVRLLAVNTGSPVNYSVLASDAGLSMPTLKRYLWYAERTFCTRFVTPYFTNKRKEITKSPVVYFTDPGFRNYVLGSFGYPINPRDRGMIFQNFIYLLLLEYSSIKGWSVHFWRSIDKAEVDFVIDKKRDVLPVEVKYSSLARPVLSRSFRSFIEKYSPDEAWIVNLDYEDEIRVNSTTVRILPYFRLPTA